MGMNTLIQSAIFANFFLQIGVLVLGTLNYRNSKALYTKQQEIAELQGRVNEMVEIRLSTVEYDLHR
jgi:hypothetical protein